jgi:hypothetical protein
MKNMKGQQTWIHSDAFWQDLIGSSREMKNTVKHYAVPSNYLDIFWGEYKKVSVK